jgi:hypothetical protein
MVDMSKVVPIVVRHGPADSDGRTMKGRKDLRGFESPRPVGTRADSVAELPHALCILRSSLREARAERDASTPGSGEYRRSETRIEYLRELFIRLQERMEVPSEIWQLDRPSGPDHAIAPREHRPRLDRVPKDPGPVCAPPADA